MLNQQGEKMSKSSKLYNEDLAPTPKSKKNWGWFEIFNVWANDVQSLFGYTLAASLFLASGLNGWAVFLALILAGFFIMWLVNLSGKPSVKHGIPLNSSFGCPQRLRRAPATSAGLGRVFVPEQGASSR